MPIYFTCISHDGLILGSIHYLFILKAVGMKDKDKIALFIDADNAPARKIDKILSELARYGVVNIYKSLWELD